MQINKDEEPESNIYTTFTEEIWQDMVDRISKLYSFNNSRKEKLSTHKIMKLVAAIPFIAECNNPMRISLSHLSVYILAASESGKDVFLHGFKDNGNIFNRLERIMHFDGGNIKIIDRGMNLIALSMIGDHHEDRLLDKSQKKYNPINAEIWNYSYLIKELQEKIKEIDCPEMDSIITAEIGPYAIWQI